MPLVDLLSKCFVTCGHSYSVTYYQWKAIAPVWPVGPDELRYYDPDNRKHAFDWVGHGDR